MRNESKYQQVAQKAIEIKTELIALGRWQEEPLAPESFENMGAFGSKTMTFEQWLQFVLVSRIETIVEQGERLPESSSTGVYAVRYFDGDHKASKLIDILNELDQLIVRKE